MLDTISSEVKEIAELITLLNSTIESLNAKLLKLDHRNIVQLNYVSLRTDTPLGNATPKDGWLRAVKLVGQTELQIYDGAAWVTLARKAYVDSQDTATLNSANAYTDNEINGLTISTVADHTHSGRVPADGAHGHSIIRP
ncbi:MAG: hypothetical protein K6T65_11765 [Peptococcaceae bacterium]|nr:hypothetical protein [Peptococcaceae bacterium]